MIISYSSNEHRAGGELAKAETDSGRESLQPEGGVGQSTLAGNVARGLQMTGCDPEVRAIHRQFQHRIDGSK